jgi:hypothetical protein
MTFDRWEYTSTFLRADIDGNGAREYAARRWPSGREFKQYSPEAMIPELDGYGRDGWELINMEPVMVGKNADVGFPSGGNFPRTAWSNVYFCVFKRSFG